MNAILSFLGSQGPILLYLLLGTGAAFENFFPPVPADTFVLLGAFLAASGRASAWAVFLVTWLAFFLLYFILPNAWVDARAALWGAIRTRPPTTTTPI